MNSDKIHIKMDKIYFFFRIKLFFLLLVFGSQTKLYAQLEVTPSSDATALAESLIGQGVVIFNPTLICNDGGAGFFDGTNSNIGLPSGVLLTSGAVNIAIGPDEEDGQGLNGGNDTNQDLDLEALSFPFPVCDNCILEFDFQPSEENLTFSYVFASEEYPEYFCDQFNDAFGFFITGINPNGGTYESENIAIIPGTTYPLTINNLGPGSCNITGESIDNSAFYISNDGGTTVEYDGFTVRLTASIPVQPCTDYHFKFAIGDAGDCIFDSGVFLEEGSFTSSSISYFANGEDITDTCAYSRCPEEEIVELTIVEDNGYNWTWSPATGLNTTTGNTVIATVNQDIIYTATSPGNGCPIIKPISITAVEDSTCINEPPPCTECPSSFAPMPGNKYVLSVWVKESNSIGMLTYESANVTLSFEGSTTVLGPFLAKGEIIDGWQRIEEEFTIPSEAIKIKVSLNNSDGTKDAFFDDVRFFPFNATMKSFVYDPVTLRLSAELDERNYATFYEYDEEGALIRIKKETARGVMTIQEARNASRKI